MCVCVCVCCLLTACGPCVPVYGQDGESGAVVMPVKKKGRRRMAHKEQGGGEQEPDQEQVRWGEGVQGCGAVLRTCCSLGERALLPPLPLPLLMLMLPPLPLLMLLPCTSPCTSSCHCSCSPPCPSPCSCPCPPSCPSCPCPSCLQASRDEEQRRAMEDAGEQLYCVCQRPWVEDDTAEMVCGCGWRTTRQR